MASRWGCRSAAGMKSRSPTKKNKDEKKNTSRKSGARRTSRRTRAKNAPGSLPTGNSLEEAIVYFLQLATEWRGEARAWDIPPGRELVSKIGTDRILAKITDDLLEHRNERWAQALLVRVAYVLYKLTPLVREAAAQLDPAERERALAAAARSLHAWTDHWSLPTSTAEARAAVEDAAGGPKRSVAARLRRDVLRMFGVAAMQEKTVLNILAILNERHRETTGAVKSLQMVEDLSLDAPAHRSDVMRYVQSLLERADDLVPGRLRQ